MFAWSNLGLILAVEGADALKASGLPAWALLAGIVRRVHEGFGALGLPPPEKNGGKGSELAGPAVAGLDRNAFSQDDADDLLSGLGL